MSGSESASRCGPCASRRGVASVLALSLGVLLMLSFAGKAHAVSAVPYKFSNDSGQISSSDLLKGNITATTNSCTAPGHTNCTIINPQACVWTDPFNNFSPFFQQWNVPGCVLVTTPWIKMGGLATEGWAAYCPASAPYNWSANGFGSISAIQQWVTSTHTGYVQPASGNSEKTKIDYYATNLSFYTNYWRYIAACSTQSFTDGHAGGKYCCGQGVHLLGQRLGEPRTGPPARTMRPRRGVRETTYEWSPQARTTRTRRFLCPRGYRLIFGRGSVGFMSAAAPARQTQRDVREKARRFGRRGYAVTITTGRIRRGDVRVQVTTDCARPGAAPYQPPRLT